MAQAASKGNCYLCGETISKTAFKKHLLEKHNDAAGDAQTCKLLKVEGADEKAYWLYLDMPVSATLKRLIGFCGISGWNAVGTKAHFLWGTMSNSRKTPWSGCCTMGSSSIMSMISALQRS